MLYKDDGHQCHAAGQDWRHLEDECHQALVLTGRYETSVGAFIETVCIGRECIITENRAPYMGEKRLGLFVRSWLLDV
jgi:hypothetical protein